MIVIDPHGHVHGLSGPMAPPSDATNIVAISLGLRYALALKRDGAVVLWGANYEEELNNIPKQLTNVVAIAAGYFHSLALTAEGTVFAWGFNTFGQADVPLLPTNVIAIAAGFVQSCFNSVDMLGSPSG